MESYDARYKKALIKEHSKIFDSNKSIIESAVEKLNECPVCKNKQYKIYCVKDLFVHKKCTNCGLVYLDPKLSREATLAFYNSEVNEIYNEKKFHQLVENAPDDLENYSNYKIIKKYISDIKGKRLLEIGPGKGTFLAKAASDGFEVHAIELNKSLIEKLKKITNHIYTDDLENINVAENFFDVIYFRDVMEHIDVPVPFLKKVHKILKPGGVLLIDTHNIESLVNKATKEYHTVIFPFEHPLHWSPDSLNYACSSVGFIKNNVFFDHHYQTLARIVEYLYHPSFTFIFPPQRSKFFTFILGRMEWILSKGKVKRIDDKFSIFISKLFGKGAKMQMLFTK